MSKLSRQREAEWAFKQDMRRRHEERTRRERAADARQHRWLRLVRHQDNCHCVCCGQPSAGPWVTPEVDVLLTPARIDWTDSVNLHPCMVCGGWLCARCLAYVPGVGRRCAANAHCPDPTLAQAARARPTAE